MVESLQVWLKGRTDIWHPFVSWFNEHLAAMIVIVVVGLLAYYIGGRLLARLVKRVVRTARHREWHQKDVEKRQNTLAAVAKSIWHIFIVIVVFVALFRESIDKADAILAPLFASAGIVGVALGFGAQSVVKDFLAGLFIIGENQYRVGDIVELADNATGTVERIGSRSTVIRDVDGNVHYLPNGSIAHVINKTMGYSMARFIITVDPTSDVKKISSIIDRIGKDLSHEEKWKNKILEPPAFVSVGEFTGTSLELIIAGKTQPSDQWAVIAEMRRRLLEALEKSEIKLAP
ncbi:MAG: mechanosensitive ion channel protein MscS, small conductance mechanosensitive channel [Candidatus Saccharibacteria bacterium]|nr:mechanosensitive ion channel protein MscS, small conductance mechanosensitive channel [Candidatus Saccharibacteria bacterium]